MQKAYIRGTGYYVPEKVVPNDFFEKVGSNDAWIHKNLGIKERRIVTDETTSDLAYKAGEQAIANAGLDLADIDLILVATTTPDRLAPSCACMVQEKLGANMTPAFDVAAVCSGALFTICTAVQFIENGMYKNVLVIGADSFSKITDWERRDSVFFGDGAGAMVLSASQDLSKGFLGFNMFSDGKGKEAFTIPAGGSEMPASTETLQNRKHYFQMDGKAVFETASSVVPVAIQQLLAKNDWNVDEVDYLVPHQPSIGILKSIAQQLDMPFEKVLTNMDKYANTSGATIPLLLAEQNEAQRFAPGDKIVFAAVGSGWTWGTALYQW